jgi:hypothetical protein
MGRTPKLVEGLDLDTHLTLGLELGAVAQALRDIRGVITAAEGSGSATYAAITKVITDVKALAVVLDRDLRDEFGDKVELRKTYKEALQ